MKMGEMMSGKGEEGDMGEREEGGIEDHKGWETGKTSNVSSQSHTSGDLHNFLLSDYTLMFLHLIQRSSSTILHSNTALGSRKLDTVVSI